MVELFPEEAAPSNAIFEADELIAVNCSKV
jgi:hypothetical protein